MAALALLFDLVLFLGWSLRASKELKIPQPMVWRVLKHCLHMKPYKLQLLQALHPDDHNKRYEF
ncbi:hypothetical protein X975_07090, partial [Stegodyphus mimosarum]